MKKKKLAFTLILVMAFGLLSGCAVNHYNLANTAYSKGDYRTAQKEYSYLTEGKPGKPRTKVAAKKLVCRSIHLGNHGVSACYAHDYKEAARILEMCVTYNEHLKGFVGQTLKSKMTRKYRFTPWEQKMIHIYLGRIYEQLGDRERSLIEYRKINESEDRTFNIAHYRLGSVFSIRNETDNAEVAYKNVLKVQKQLKKERANYDIGPFDYAALDLGFIYTARKGEWRTEAKKYFDQYISTDPEAINSKKAAKYLKSGKNSSKDLGVVYITMDVPYYSKTAYAKVYVNNKYYARTELLEDLLEHKGRYELQLKKLAKGVAKEIVGDVTRDAAIELASSIPCLGFFMDQFLNKEKETDVPRVFNKWPSLVCVSKLYVDPGKHTIEFNFEDTKKNISSGGCITPPIKNKYIQGDDATAKFNIEVGKGEMVFVNYNPHEWLYKKANPASGL